MNGITLELNAEIATLWLDRPEKKNALTLEMLDGIAQAIDQAEADTMVKCLIVRGRKGTFCSGIDVGVFPGGPHAISAAAKKAAGVFAKLYHSPVPSICAIEGFCTGAGFELMLSADVAIASATSKIGEISMRLGMFGGAGPIYHLPRILGVRRSKELVLTGKILSGSQAAEWGLINECVDEGGLNEAISQLAAQLTDKPPYQLALTKSVMNAGLDADTHSLMLMERLAFDLTVSGADAAEGLSALMEKRKPNWRPR